MRDSFEIHANKNEVIIVTPSANHAKDLAAMIEKILKSKLANLAIKRKMNRVK